MVSTIDEREEKNHMKTTIDSLKDVKITHNNFKIYTDRVANKCEIIETQIESLRNKYNLVFGELEEKERDDKISRMIKDDRIVPSDIYLLRKELSIVAEDLLVWKSLEEKMLEIIFFKLVGALGAVKSLDIEREVTKGLKDMNTAYFNFMKEHLMDKNNEMERKISEFKNEVNLRFDALTHKMTSLVTTKIIEAQTEDRVTVRTKELEDVHKIADGYSEDKVTPKVKLEKDAVSLSTDKKDEGFVEFYCEECDEAFQDEAEQLAHNAIVHKGGVKE